jgi:hypothetical protein
LLLFCPLYRQPEEEENMKRLYLIAMLGASLVAAGCSSFQSGTGASSMTAVAQPAVSAAPARNAGTPADQITVQDEAGSVVVQKVEFKPGVSSATVERLGKRFGCTGRTGAGLVTEKGPVEVYRMQCDNGTTFLAQCELRQCRPLR